MLCEKHMMYQMLLFEHPPPTLIFSGEPVVLAPEVRILPIKKDHAIGVVTDFHFVTPYCVTILDWTVFLLDPAYVRRRK